MMPNLENHFIESKNTLIIAGAQGINTKIISAMKEEYAEAFGCKVIVVYGPFNYVQKQEEVTAKYDYEEELLTNGEKTVQRNIYLSKSKIEKQIMDSLDVEEAVEFNWEV
ncbi:hypothetical protein [Carnobacterium maltaromaticum]|uniref:hypothetical protein n=1 Tax=Carnobacterium maltaromaticum TaxID=2751 RepID=UPI0039BECF20